MVTFGLLHCSQEVYIPHVHGVLTLFAWYTYIYADEHADICIAYLSVDCSLPHSVQSVVVFCHFVVVIAGCSLSAMILQFYSQSCCVSSLINSLRFNRTLVSAQLSSVVVADARTGSYQLFSFQPRKQLLKRYNRLPVVHVFYFAY